MVAYTYEFDDPTHSNETAYARAVCRHMGIRDHHIIGLTLDAFIHEIPQTVLRAESPTH